MRRLRVLNAVIYLEVLSRPGRGGMFLLSSLLEPLALISVLMLIFTAVGTEAAHGGSLFVFLITGMLPHFTAMRVALRVMGVERGWRQHQKIPGVIFTDYIFASGMIEVLLYVTIGVLLLLGSFAAGYAAILPERVLVMLYAISLLALLGLGVGIINIVIIRFFPVWEIIYAVSQRILLFLSGLFYVVDYAPILIRDIVVYNPISHGITMFRLGFYGKYPHITMDIGYLFWFGFVALFIGLFLERITRNIVIQKVINEKS